MGNHRILVINLGSTSSDAAVFEGEQEIVSLSVSHTTEELDRCPDAEAQMVMRKALIEEVLREKGVPLSSIQAIAARGIGATGRYSAGAYRVSARLAEDAKTALHKGMAAGALLAYQWSEELGIPAYLYDVVWTDEITEVARVSGTPAILRSGATHTLNTKAVARQTAADLGRSYGDVTFIMCHLGGGISTSLHQNGRIVDTTATDEGTFSADRSGRLPCDKLMRLFLSGKYSESELKAMLRGKAGLIGYLHTNDCREIERRIAGGDKEAELIYRAMAYQTAKDIGALAAAACGRVDAIVLTGGIAHSQLFTGWITEYVGFIAPVLLRPGSMELLALARGVGRVLNGEETAQEYLPGETVL